MKRLLSLLLLAALLACLLGGCVTANTVHDPVETKAGGQTVVVQYDDGSFNTGTVTAENGDVYRFEASFGAERTTGNFTYPDGSRYTARSDDGSDGNIDDFLVDYGEYISAYALLSAVTEAKPFTVSDLGLNWGNIGIAVVLIIFGIICLSAPEAVWTMNRGWRYKNAEPSNAGLAVYRILGGILLLVGGFMLFISLF